MDNVELEFTNEAISEIAELAIKKNTGARGLRTILENIMQDIMFEIPSDASVQKVIINEKCVTSNEAPELIKSITKKVSKKSSVQHISDGKSAC